ncbi:5-oxoprolinase subunit PxpB [Robiginitalea marina]|uniref:5-oxoprolinase subunit PxpB n=1 Tax=Robiginitalea marina TaxID=2954105 RepID=A0ABT1AU28_9FLAO|nr:5-oxoprolinase subunit PxpB [Robiginitalea marina]MCO5723437.1 5-oxoprolinase subunit PxpB [Robiginitalea marina]
MSEAPFHIKPFGREALLLEWPAGVSEETLMDVLGFMRYLRDNHLPESEWEFIPVYHSLTLISYGKEKDLERVTRNLPAWYHDYPGPGTLSARCWELPVCYDPPFAPDLEEVARILNTTEPDLVRSHTAQPYRVFGIGFLPGFLYLGGVPETLRLPRRDHPRLRVPAGAVGLADRQTGIYPQESPGGWHLIGNCPVPLFNPEAQPPCFISPGDQVRFRAVSPAEYELHKIEGEIGIYNFREGEGNA